MVAEMKRRGTPRAGKKGKGRRREPRVHQAPAPTPASPFLRDLARVGAAASEATERARGSIAKFSEAMRKGAAGIDPAAFRLPPGHSLISTPEAEAVARQMEALEDALRPLEVLRRAGFEVMTREEVLAEARQSAAATGEFGLDAVRRIVAHEKARIEIQSINIAATPEMIRRLAAGELFFDTPEGRAEAARRRADAESDAEYKARVSRYFAPARPDGVVTAPKHAPTRPDGTPWLDGADLTRLTPAQVVDLLNEGYLGDGYTGCSLHPDGRSIVGPGRIKDCEVNIRIGPEAKSVSIAQYSDPIVLTAKDLGCEVVIDVTDEPHKALDERAPRRRPGLALAAIALSTPTDGDDR